MRRDDLLNVLQQRPFRPFRLVLTSGPTYEVRHPEMAIVTPSSIHLGLAGPGTPPPAADDVVLLSLLRVMRIEFLTPAAPPATNN